MKKPLFCFFIFFILSLFSCSNYKKNNLEEKPKILCTTQMISDGIKKIVGDEIVVETLINGEVDPHSYQLVKGDLEKIQQAKIIFCNGLNLEHGASLKVAIANHPKAVLLGDIIYKQDPNQILVVDGEFDPHIWMDVSLWIQTVDISLQAIKEVFPDQQELFEQNAKNLKEKLINLDLAMFLTLQSIPQEKRYLVTSHDAFNYFSRRYLATDIERNNGTWQVRFKAPEGLSPDGQIGPYDIKMILSFLKEHNISVVFPESNVSIDSLKKIISVAKNQGVKIVFSTEPLFGDSMCGEKLSVNSYEEMMQHNTNVITNYLNADY